MAIELYNKNRQGLDQVAFVRDTLNQKAIREINDSYELAKQFTILFADIFNRMGFKGEIEIRESKDIKELILMHFKGLSLDEIAYAFKLERYGQNWEKTDHYQLFNAEYVGQVLKKYVEWKREVKSRNNISMYRQNKKKISEEEKRYWINRGVNTAFSLYQETRSVPENYIYVYDILYEKFLPKDKEYKKKIKEDALVALQIEYKDKKPLSRGESLQIKNVLGQIEQRNTKSNIVIMKCKELVLMSFFRKLMKDEKLLKSFKLEYNYEEFENSTRDQATG